MEVIIGHYRVNNGETLLTETLENNFNHAFIPTNTVIAPYYTVIFVDLDAPYPDDNYMSPYLHYMVVNYDPHNKTGNVTVTYKPPSPPQDSDAHKYVVYMFRQQKRMPKPSIETRENFDVGDFLEYERSEGRPLVGEYMTFYGIDHLPSTEMSRSPSSKDLFSEMYDVEKLSEEDIQDIAAVYSIPNAYTLTKGEIISKINKILSFNK